MKTGTEAAVAAMRVSDLLVYFCPAAPRPSYLLYVVRDGQEAADPRLDLRLDGRRVQLRQAFLQRY